MQNAGEDAHQDAALVVMPLAAAVFMQRSEFPANAILGNSEVPRHGKGPWSLSFAGALALHVCTTVIRVGLDYEQTAERSSSKWLT